MNIEQRLEKIAEACERMESAGFIGNFRGRVDMTVSATRLESGAYGLGWEIRCPLARATGLTFEGAVLNLELALKREISETLESLQHRSAILGNLKL